MSSEEAKMMTFFITWITKINACSFQMTEEETASMVMSHTEDNYKDNVNDIEDP